MEIPHPSISASAVAGTATRYSDCFLRALKVKDVSNDVLVLDGRSNTAINTQLRFLLHAENSKSSAYFAISEGTARDVLPGLQSVENSLAVEKLNLGCFNLRRSFVSC